MPQISVVVPVYNTEKYLSQCIDSILAQTFTDFELILINDGSSDTSGKICDDYAQNDSRIVVIHKENGGVSSARNNGLDSAKGEWIMFVDSDDYLSVGYLSAFHMDVTHDMEICGMETISNNNQSFCPKQTILYTKKNMSKFYNDIFDKPYVTSPCAKILKRALLNKYNVRFDEKIKITEDTLFIMDYLTNCSSIYLIPNSGYYYRNPENIANKYRQSADCMNYNLNKLSSAVIKLSKKFDFNPSKIIQAVSRFHYSCFSSNLELLSDEEAVNEWRKYRKYDLKQYHFKMTCKESLYRFLCIYFPSVFYVRMRHRQVVSQK